MDSEQVVRVIHPKPDIAKGVQYWQGVPATVDGVLGGYGLGTLPRIDAMGSRLFLLKHQHRLNNIPPASADPQAWIAEKRQWRLGAQSEGKPFTTALDCGAGVGRVTENTLLPIIDEVHMVEPVYKFLAEAKKESAQWKPLQHTVAKQPFRARKAVYFHEATPQKFDPSAPSSTAAGKRKAPEDAEPSQKTVIAPTFSPASDAAEGSGPVDGPTDTLEEGVRYDVIWIQWCLQHLSDADLISFFRRCKRALKPPRTLEGNEPKDATEEKKEEELNGGMIFVKENVCGENEDGSEKSIWDDEDHSITRSTNAYERVMREAGLQLVDCQTQLGFPQELFAVKMWALR